MKTDKFRMWGWCEAAALPSIETVGEGRAAEHVEHPEPLHPLRQYCITEWDGEEEVVTLLHADDEYVVVHYHYRDPTGSGKFSRYPWEEIHRMPVEYFRRELRAKRCCARYIEIRR